MATIDTARVLPTLPQAELWPEVARATLDWLASRGMPARDAAVLLPYAALLAPARAAFAAAGGWQPRIETPATLAASLRAPEPPLPGRVSGDPVLDRLTATALLSGHGWAQAWARRDRRGFEHLVAQVVESAQTLALGAAQRPPSQREAFWQEARAGIQGAAGGPGHLEALLLQAALEWAALGGSEPTDALFTLDIGAWVGVRIGGGDGLVERLLAEHPAPALMIDADPPVEAPFPAPSSSFGPMPQRWVCDDLESEAQAAASLVLTALARGEQPVALIASDRVLVRRIRSLLERRRVVLSDETGWRLSTTPAAARLMALLRAAGPDASPDARLDWLKGLGLGPEDERRIRVLEAHWREARRLPDEARAEAEAWWQAISAQLAPLALRGPLRLPAWLQSLAEVRERCATLAGPGAAADDAAAEGAIARALRLHEADAGWQAAAAALSFDLTGFSAWVDSVLEATNHEPAPQPGAPVVLTPLARAVGRDFGHVVLPAADDQHLGALAATPTLIGENLAQRLGLDSAARRQQRQLLAFAQLLRVPRLSLLRRRVDEGQPLAPSPFVRWLAAVREEATRAEWPEARWVAATQAVPARPQPRPMPAAPQALPSSLSASTVEALRQCPYRFFAKAVLRLEDLGELDAPLAKRDYGNWLHTTLHRFHERRAAGAAAPDAALLAQAAEAATAELRLEPAALLPYEASFEVFAPRYLAWLAAREAAGWRWAEGETDHACDPPSLAPQRLRSRLDRIDHGPGGSVAVIDYKTGDLGGLKKKVKEPLEDTQLALYAALLRGSGAAAGPIEAMYLALDCDDAPQAVIHPGVDETARALIDGLSADLADLRAGAAMPALGEGRVCETCEARGLCRRDHWLPDLPSADDAL